MTSHEQAKSSSVEELAGLKAASIAPAEIVARLFPRRRSTLTVTIDLDPVPGWGNSAEDHRALVQRLLDDAVGHYNPRVEIVTGEG